MRRRLGRYRAPVVAVAVASALVAVALWPVTTSVGIDFHVTTYRIPLYEKALAFLYRDVELRRVAAAAAAGSSSEEDRAMRLLRWAYENVRPQPAGLPVVDDHVYNIIIRGYGDSDQAADVFATLAGYDGIPATLVFARRADGSVVYPFAYAYVDGDWRVFDVRGGQVLLDGASAASLDRLRRDPSITRGLASPPEVGAISYPEIVALLPDVPERLRADDQMPLSRLAREVRSLFGR